MAVKEMKASKVRSHKEKNIFPELENQYRSAADFNVDVCFYLFCHSCMLSAGNLDVLFPLPQGED